jgi:hypothetical protein
MHTTLIRTLVDERICVLDSGALFVHPVWAGAMVRLVKETQEEAVRITASGRLRRWHSCLSSAATTRKLWVLTWDKTLGTIALLYFFSESAHLVLYCGDILR